MTKLPDGILVENWTMHEVHLLCDDGVTITIPPEPEGPAHVQFLTDQHDGSKFLTATRFGPVTRLPPPRKVEGEQVYLIVSGIVRQALPLRHDIVVQYKTIRTSAGALEACRGFALSAEAVEA